MVPINRRKVSLYEEAKNGLSSLVWQTTTVFVGFIFILLLTGGNPSGFAITLNFVLSIAFVAWREQNRFTKLRKDPDVLLNAIKKRMRPQKMLETQTRLSESVNKLAQSLGSLKESELNALKRTFDRQQAAVRKAGGQGNFADLELEEKKLILAEKLALLKLNPISQQQQFEADSEQLKHRYYIAVPEKISTDKNVAVKSLRLANSSEPRFRSVHIKKLDTIKDSDTDIVLRRVSVSSSIKTNDIKTRLFELKAVIIDDDNLTDKSKADALRYLEAIAEISLQQNETIIQT